MNTSFRKLKQTIRAIESNHKTPRPVCRRRFNFALSTIPHSKTLTPHQYNYILRGGDLDEDTPDHRRYNKRRRDNRECTGVGSWSTLGGVYFVSNNQIFPSSKTRLLGQAPVNVRREVKIGLAGSSQTLHRRLNNYLLYWPMGVVVYGLLLVDGSTLLRSHKKLMLKVIRKHQPKQNHLVKWIIRALEVYAHNYFKHTNKRYRIGFDAQSKKHHGHLSEWFVLKPNEIFTFLNSNFHSNVVKNINELMLCYTDVSPYLVVLKRVYESVQCRQVLIDCIKIIRFNKHKWCHFKKSSVKTRISRARNQQQNPTEKCAKIEEKIEANRKYLREVPIREFRMPKDLFA